MNTCEICGSELDAGRCPVCSAGDDANTMADAKEPVVPGDLGLFGEAKGADFFGVVTPTLADNSEPLPTVRPKKSKAWMYAVGGFAAVVIGVGVVSASFLGLFVGNTNETAGYVPADAQGYFVFDLVDSGAVFSDGRVQSLMAQIEREFGVEVPDLQGSVVEEEILNDMADALGVNQVNLSFRDDVASWAGRYVGMWFRADISVDAQPEDANGCMLVEARDVGQADRALERIYEEISQGDIAMTRSEVDGLAVYSWTGEVVVKAGRIDGVVALCGGAGTFEEVKAVHESGVSLASSESFTRLESALGDWAMMGYLDTEKLVQDVMVQEGIDNAPFARAGRLAFAANLTDAGFTFESVSELGPEFPVIADGMPAANILPGNVYFAAGGQDLGQTILSLIDAYRGIPEMQIMIDEVFVEFRQSTGVELTEVFESMEGPFGVAVSADGMIEEVPIGAVLFTELTDRRPIDDVLSFVNEQEYLLPIERISAPYDVMVYGFGLVNGGVGVSDDRLVFAIEDDMIDRMASGPVLSDDQAFQEAVGFLPDSAGWVAYADFGKIVDAVLTAMDADITTQVEDLEFKSALEIAGDRFPYMVAGVETVDGLVRQTAILVFTEGSDPGA
ncbi:MAG: DUF3352 domain-containing protein [Acidimicrobiia bacterium]|nr:DUF3352 domain-containing protein [Acidimicrobiia bacterium]MDH5504034.1 DUF3352 domain-containing protein [Acidimicrobiia bacterium]